MENQALAQLVHSIASGYVSYVASEDPAALGGLTPAAAVQTLVAGGVAALVQLTVSARPSGAFQITASEIDPSCPFSSPCPVVATVSRGGYVWVPGGVVSGAVLNAAW
jgi:hypothetical protein